MITNFSNLFLYILKKRWYSTFGLIFINLMAYLYKFVQYRKLIEFISKIGPVYFFMYTNKILVSFFINFLFCHIFYNISNFFLEKTIINSIKKLFGKMVTRMMHYNVEFYKKNNNNKISELWFYINSAEILMEKLILELPRIVVFILYYVYTIYTFSPKFLFYIIPINMAMIGLMHLFSTKQHKYQQDRLEIDIATKNRLLEATANIEYVKLTNNETNEILKIGKSYVEYIKNKIRDREIGSVISLLSHVFDDVQILLIYSLGIFFVLTETMNPVELLYLAVYTGSFYYQLVELRDIYNYYQRVTPKLDIINEILSYDEMENKDKRICVDLEDKEDTIVFEDISFRYEKDIPVLENINFIFKKNKINVLLGPNGSGKSTLIKLLLRFYELDYQGGNIYFKGKNIKDISLSQLRDEITFVSHEPYIFNDTILNNIKYGNKDINYETTMEICRLLNLEDWFEKYKYKDCGFRGKNLSGGEKKKIQLIWALCKRSSVIIFDEPSNSLDSNAIKWFIELITLLKTRYLKTVIIITHDLRMINMSDHVIDLNP